MNLKKELKQNSVIDMFLESFQLERHMFRKDITVAGDKTEIVGYTYGSLFLKKFDIVLEKGDTVHGIASSKQLRFDIRSEDKKMFDHIYGDIKKTSSGLDVECTVLNKNKEVFVFQANENETQLKLLRDVRAKLEYLQKGDKLSVIYKDDSMLAWEATKRDDFLHTFSTEYGNETYWQQNGLDYNLLKKIIPLNYYENIKDTIQRLGVTYETFLRYLFINSTIGSNSEQIETMLGETFQRSKTKN